MSETLVETSMWTQLIEFAFMLVIDLMFVLGLCLLMLPIGIRRQAAFAVLERNFTGYFSKTNWQQIMRLLNWTNIENENVRK